MNEIILKHEEIDNIFKSHLKIESKVMSIDSIFSNPRMEKRINYKPYYQRNYVWDKEKATYFIESILIGTEIPPLVFFKNKKIEIIDGRQRYETIKNFIDKKLTLTKKGLHSLIQFSKFHFASLDEETKNTFLNTQIRILEFSVVNEPKLNDRKEDLIKKEIFRRYNSGITPLKKPEIERALYISDDLTSYFKKEIIKDNTLYEFLVKLFLSERDYNAGKKRVVIEKLMSKLRLLMTTHFVPIKKYSYGNNRSDLMKNMYEYYSSTVDDVTVEYQKFLYKIQLLNRVEKYFKENGEANHNKLVNECSIWMMNILEQEDLLKKVNDDFMAQYTKFIIANSDVFSLESSHFYKNVLNRYSIVANFISDYFGISTTVYIDSPTNELVIHGNDSDNDGVITTLDSIRLSKPEPTSMTIDDITRMMDRNHFLIRPAYQRHEVINRVKSSALIESILLGIKLPPIFIYRRTDGVHEVLDGQQRLLSIIGFIGSEYVNEEGKRVKSEKNKYKLKQLRILSEWNNYDFENLDEELHDKIYDFNLSVVIIDEKLNPNFDNIDLFIRLNNKPYPVRENSFEMWNSYIDKDIISTIKANLDSHSNWFYLKKPENDKRMANYELYTTIAYLEYKKRKFGIDNIDQFLNIYQRNENINTRIKQKKDVTKLLDDVTVDRELKPVFMECIHKVEKFIDKLKNLLSSGLEDFDLVTELNELLGIKKSKRTTQSFYSLWLILNQIDSLDCEELFVEIKQEIRDIIANMKNCTDNDVNWLDRYNKSLELFHKKYLPLSKS